jgi:hypothetical protein
VLWIGFRQPRLLFFKHSRLAGEVFNDDGEVVVMGGVMEGKEI